MLLLLYTELLTPDCEVRSSYATQPDQPVHWRADLAKYAWWSRSTMDNMAAMLCGAPCMCTYVFEGLRFKSG